MAPIFIISGPPGAGKSSLADALLQRFPFGIHLPVDDMRDMVVSGRADPVPTWTEETTRQFQLARTSMAEIAARYAAAGFAVAIDDIIFPGDTDLFFGFPGFEVQRILLLPALETMRRRNSERTNKHFDTSILDETIIALHEAMQSELFNKDGWIVIDSSALSLDETVDEVLRGIKS